MEDALLTPEQVAKRLQVTPRTIYDWLRHGRLPGIKIGRLWRVRPEDLQTFLKAPGADNRIRPTAGEVPALREYRQEQIREFMEADRLDPETARKVERLLAP